MTAPVRIGVLGCGSVVDYAILQPARDENAIVVSAVASRDAAKAAAYAARMGVEQSFGGYQALLDAKVADAIYVALPNSMHHQWTLAALEAGYPVVCEKPLASNAAEATEMVARAKALGLPLIEAFHWRHHPGALRAREMLEAGTIGRLERIEAVFHIPAFYLDSDNIRLDASLSGGSTMDQGCYCIDLIRWYAGAEPEVVSARAETIHPEVDGAMTAEFRFGNGLTASTATSMSGDRPEIDCNVTFIGERGRLRFTNPFTTQLGCRLALSLPEGETVETPTPTPSYTFQARAIADIVRGRAPAPDGDGSVANMRVIDMVYRRAGMMPRAA